MGAREMVNACVVAVVFGCHPAQAKRSCRIHNLIKKSKPTV
jgi:hypothetical protein